jgi:hypothetical protein
MPTIMFVDRGHLAVSDGEPKGGGGGGGKAPRGGGRPRAPRDGPYSRPQRQEYIPSRGNPFGGASEVMDRRVTWT